eukprot:8749965-Pyramimonas_sp.AAC.1
MFAYNRRRRSPPVDRDWLAAMVFHAAGAVRVPQSPCPRSPCTLSQMYPAVKWTRRGWQEEYSRGAGRKTKRAPFPVSLCVHPTCTFLATPF